MAKYCRNCGAGIDDGSKFCKGCGANVEETPVSSVQQQAMSPPVQQSPQQMYAAVPPKKSNTKLIVGVIVAIVAIVVVLLVVFVFFGDGLSLGGANNSVVGTWEYTDTSTGTPLNIYYKFESDGDFEAGSSGVAIFTGTWRLNGNQLCTLVTSIAGQDEECYTYSINGNQMSWDTEIGTLTLTKTS